MDGTDVIAIFARPNARERIYLSIDYSAGNEIENFFIKGTQFFRLRVSLNSLSDRAKES